MQGKAASDPPPETLDPNSKELSKTTAMTSNEEATLLSSPEITPTPQKKSAPRLIPDLALTMSRVAAAVQDANGGPNPQIPCEKPLAETWSQLQLKKLKKLAQKPGKR